MYFLHSSYYKCISRAINHLFVLLDRAQATYANLSADFAKKIGTEEMGYAEILLEYHVTAFVP